MRWSSKHGDRETQKSLSDLSGGLNWGTNQENIAENELWVADNWEYDQQSGALKTVDGLVSRFNAEVSVDRLFYDHVHLCWIFSSGTTLYRTDLSTKVSLGTLAGTGKPTFDIFGSDLMIASGSGLQKWDGTTLSAIADAPDTALVRNRKGRVLSFCTGTDRMTQSAVGDDTDWDTTLTGDADAKYLDVGYKDSGVIVAVGFLADDILVWKTSNRVYRIVGEYPDWVVKEVTRDGDCIAQGAVASVGNDVMFLGSGGFQSFQTVNAYGDIKSVDSFGAKINPSLSRNIDTNARVWHVPSKKQVWVKGQNDQTALLYHYQGDRFTRRRFPYALNDVFTLGTVTYVACGNYICQLDRSVAADLGTALQTNLEAKRYSTPRFYLVKKVSLEAYGEVAGSGSASFGGITLPFTIGVAGDVAFSDDDVAYSDTDPLVTSSFFRVESNNKRTRTRSASLKVSTTSGAVSLRNIFVTLVEV